MKNKIPFIPISYSKLIKITEHFLGIGENISKMFPSMEFDLEQAEIPISPRRWASIAFFAFMLYFFMIFGMMFVLTIAIAKAEITMSLVMSFLSGLAIGTASMFFLLFYPKLTARKKIRDIEKNLPHVLHHILVQVRSGVPLYNTFVSIAKTDYGILSGEIRKVVNEINTGKSEAEALEKLTRETPSLFFRRVMWQLINSLKSGSDIGSTMKEIVASLAVEQRVSIKKYGSTLNPLALMYMMLAVIFPTLGITFLLVLSSFTGIAMDMHMILIAILGALLFFQFMFIGLIKSRRPIGID
ncbi:MAG: type II secretion system F family protein [Candidatus Aenigmarchaeota archaeon]|nr:type II secretion system F family protein [Candidatus Aenigmarchaeota archaeon]